MVQTSKLSAAAKNRFIYYPDHLVCMPEPSQGFYAVVWKILTEPVFQGSFKMLFEYMRPRRSIDLKDESVRSFLARRAGGTDIPDNLASAVFHGIYAGDIDKLSARSILSAQWGMEGAYGSLGKGLPHAIKFHHATAEDETMAEKEKDLFTDHERSIVQDASVYTFRRGIGTLSEALVSSLRSNPNVKIKLGEFIASIEYDSQNEGLKVHNIPLSI